MAIWYGSALGRGKNKFGNAVLAKWKGLNVFKIYNPEVANPNTEKQQMVRERFATCASLAKQMRTPITMGLKALADALNSTIYGVFISENWRAVLATTPGSVVVNYSELVLAKGGLPGVSVLRLDLGANEHLTIEVQYAGNVGQEGTDSTDEVYAYVYNSEMKQGVLSSSSIRSENSVSVAVPNAWDGMRVEVYLLVMGRGDNTNGQVADSVFAGGGEVQ